MWLRLHQQMYEPLELALCLIVNTVIKLYQIDYSVWYVNKKIWKIEPFFKHIQQKILSSQRFLQTSLIFSLLMRASWYIPKDYSQPVGTWYSPRNHGKTCQHIFLCDEESWLPFFLSIFEGFTDGPIESLYATEGVP